MLYETKIKKGGMISNKNEPRNRIFADFLGILGRSTDLVTEDPVRDELFSVERLELYAAYLAQQLAVTSDRRRGRSLLPGLKQNGVKLLDAYLSLTAAIRDKQAVSPGAEWFVDNFHIIEDQLRSIKQDLPQDYYHELPKLAAGELKDYPRVYAIAMAVIAHTDSRLDADTLRRFIQAYQQVSPLKIGELWAVAITLRIALLGHLTPLTERIACARENRGAADSLADQLLELAVHPGVQPHELVQLLSRELGPPADYNRAFIVQLIQRLRDQDPDIRPAFDWLEKQLQTHHDTSTSQVVQLELHRQASAQVTVGNIISSLRLLATLDWRDFFESVSAVDPILAADPAAAYSKMDFQTRDRYRHAVERIARRSTGDELEICHKAVTLSAAAKAATPDNQRRAHIGYYLIAEGLAELENFFNYRPRFKERIHRLILRYPAFFYLGTLTGLTLLFLLPFRELHWAFWSLAAFPASELALGIINYYVTFLISPQALPKMDTLHGLPEDAQTIVVIPTLFTSANAVRNLLESIELHALGNADPVLAFALLGDFSDADTECAPNDDAILTLARQGIDKLNAQYPAAHFPRFHLFHRRRQWNPSEGKWIGWERKRGKLLEFNRLLRGARDTSYLGKPPDFKYLSRFKYVITLDSDTQLPRDAAHQLIRTIIHPLNQPRYDARKKRVTAGYGILQPRISVDLVSAAQTRFARLYSGNTGLDVYTTAVSDVYQDLFAEGSFTGKGLYVVDAFELALADRVPENVVLSHDLFEGSYARSALVTDIELFDDYPPDFDTFSKRAHRWTRGDWQIAPWLFPWVSDAQGRLVSNHLPLIARWKIFDNLRRSLLPVATLAWLILAWTIIPGPPAMLTLSILAVLAFPIYAPCLSGPDLKLSGLPWRGYLLGVLAQTRIRTGQVALMIAFLPNYAWTQADAIFRTLYRKFVSGKKLLEWLTFAQSHIKRRKILSFAEIIFSGPFLSLLTGALIIRFRVSALPIASPFLLLWFTAPFIKHWVGRSPPCAGHSFEPGEIRTFRRYARRTWHYFETFISPRDHWLAPDNYQLDPKPIIAHRTSPTNIGLQLLATTSAFDLGYLGCLEFVESLEKTFLTLGRLEKLHGHLFNWYDTLTLVPLQPQYISTVDSGNLAGHLIAVKQACRKLAENPGPSTVSITGLADTLHELLEEADKVEEPTQNSEAITIKQLQESILACLEQVAPGVPEAALPWAELLTYLAPRLAECEDILNGIAAEENPEKLAETRIWLVATQKQVREFQRDLQKLKAGPQSDVAVRLTALMNQCDELVLGMDFRFLFDEQRKLFAIGYNVAESRRDNSYYDLLASESRLASFIAIAKGDVSQEHWFRLGRKMAATGTSRALIAWTATMFEYLMPVLVMRGYRNTLLDQTYNAVVARQIEYAAQLGVPWGISEAGYNARDLQHNFQYGPFGIPGLGLKRGLSNELVISPYSTMLAAMIDPRAALANLERLSGLQAFSQYGFFESIDYTPSRLPENQKSFVVRSFMSHHQGMSLVSINNLLHDSLMQRRFHADPLVQATELLLQERIPRAVALLYPRTEEVRAYGTSAISSSPSPRLYSNVNLPTPRTQLLSNGTYSVMVTSAGSGFSRSGRLAVTRWREDLTRDNWGQYIYLRKPGADTFWSTGFQPTLVKPDEYTVSFGEDKVGLSRRDGEILTHTEIIVSPEDNVELRRLSLTNRGFDPVELEATSFMEIVLAPPVDDAAHPAFSNLFVQTEFAPVEGALLATRRRRSPADAQPWGFHVVVTEGKTLGHLQYETDRARFIGRGRDVSRPRALDKNRTLAGTVGAVLDPVFSLRVAVRILPGETVYILFATGVADSRADALRLADKYHDLHIFVRAANLAWIQSRIQLRHLNIDVNQAHNFQRLAGRIIYSDPSLRPRPFLLGLNTKTQAGLWAYGISGDHPLILTRISDERDMFMVRELLHAHEYLRLKGLTIDLVILNERAPSYLQSLQDELQRQLRMSGSHALLDKPGGVFMRRADIMPAEDLLLLKTVARVVLSAEKGTLEEQLARRIPWTGLPENLTPRGRGTRMISAQPPVVPALTFFNGTGGFTEDAREYVIVLKEAQWTPAPWINVVANPLDFGFLISESGAGYTWSANSRENRLTSWSNDAISDPVSEALYIRDEDSGEYWSPTPLPVRENGTYVIRHGQGYTQFEHSSHNISQCLHVSVPLDASVKISRLRLKNSGDGVRRLSVTSYAEWVLGLQRETTAPTIITEIDPRTGAIFARNPYNNEFAQRVAFAELIAEERTLTCDREEFMGRNGSTARPAALRRKNLSGASGAGLDPCAAFQTHFVLRPGEEREFVFLLGQAENPEKAHAIIIQYRKKDAVEAALKAVVAFWNTTLGAIEIKTPDASINTLVNRWLLYQALSCRVWARSGFYQSGGAIGFRDQLQDVMALVYSQPELARRQILTAASRQFEEGDVQHWWHPPTGRGVRTRFSDDLLWLPFVTNFYVSVTGDYPVLEESVSFIDAAELEAGQDDSYQLPRTSLRTATVFEHCARALDRSLKTGIHGLPLMGSGDWNDGMNRVGHQGRGESVWVGWFLHRTLSQFSLLCDKAGQNERGAIYRSYIEKLKTAIEKHAWDGQWYRRAFFDDGSPLGASTNKECQIDSIAQSWAVLSGAGDPERSRQAMTAVNERLVHRGDGLIKLFTPPFDQGSADPGYIKGYVPGVRENGGQYTHAAIWTVMAYAAEGDGDRAMELFSMLNPIHHAKTRPGVNRYKVEPYVMAADIYGLSPHVGRGGWTWYTGSASWMYRAALESILGFELRDKVFCLKPCIPRNWPGFEMIYRRGDTRYLISVTNSGGQEPKASPSIRLDGALLDSAEIPIRDDAQSHTVQIDL